MLTIKAMCWVPLRTSRGAPIILRWRRSVRRSEEHTSELQSQSNLVCRLLLEKKKNKHTHTYTPLSSSSRTSRPTTCPAAPQGHHPPVPLPRPQLRASHLRTPADSHDTLHPTR